MVTGSSCAPASSHPFRFSINAIILLALLECVSCNVRTVVILLLLALVVVVAVAELVVVVVVVLQGGAEDGDDRREKRDSAEIDRFVALMGVMGAVVAEVMLLRDDCGCMAAWTDSELLLLLVVVAAIRAADGEQGQKGPAMLLRRPLRAVVCGCFSVVVVVVVVAAVLIKAGG